MRQTATEDITFLTVTFEPTSVFLDSFQVYNWTYNAGAVYFDSVVVKGTEIWLTPPDAVRFTNSSSQLLNITEVGRFSLLSSPFGALEFSTDNTVWNKAVTLTFPNTLYVRHPIKALELDPVCDASIELVLWQGSQYQSINELGQVVANDPLPNGSFVGGFEYNVQ